MAAPRTRQERDPYQVEGKWLFAAAPSPTVVPEGFLVTKLPARGRAPSQHLRAKGDTTGHSHAAYYHGSKVRHHNAARK